MLFALAAPFVGLADVVPASLFMDHMVLQRQTQAPVWGTADVGEVVTVTGSWGESASVSAGANGKWQVALATPPAGGPHTLTIAGNNTITINDVLSGEVWLCSGQSNMEWSMRALSTSSRKRTAPQFAEQAAYIKQEMKRAEDVNLRVFTVTPNTITSPVDLITTAEGQWLACAPANTPGFSGTAYFFARELRRALPEVPVGLIVAAKGGTRVSPWMPAEAYQHSAWAAEYFADYHAQLADWDADRAQTDYQAALAAWKASGKQGEQPKAPKDLPTYQQFPSTKFNCMIYPLIPYAIKGAIWYQGENNATRNTPHYEGNFRAMITAWRARWGQGDFPVYFAQLANWKKRALEPQESDGWASICDQQRRTLGLKNTGMAVLYDIGEAKDIHPHNKIDVGKRLALWALKHDYDQPIAVCSGPLYQSHRIEGNRVVITFDSVGSGLMAGAKPAMGDTVATQESLKHFQICGADRQWVWADAEITGKDTVTVSHPSVPAPTVVRYAWARNAGSANLYNKEGLPASVFTTEIEIPE
jgi:sialate O-acetylesterase